MSPVRHHAIIWNSTGILLIGSSGKKSVESVRNYTNFRSKIRICKCRLQNCGQNVDHMTLFKMDDDVSWDIVERPVIAWWRHKWEHFPGYWPFVRGIHRSLVNPPHKGQWRGALTFSLICAWINGWVNNRVACGLGRNRAHYDITVMHWNPITWNSQDDDFDDVMAWASCQIRKIAGAHARGNAGNVFPVTTGKRSRHASRHVRHARAVMHAGIANLRFPLKMAAGKNFPGIPGACATCYFTYLVRDPWEHFPHYWFFVRGNRLSLYGFPMKDSALTLLLCAWTICKKNSWVACDLRRHHAHVTSL